MFIIKMSKVKFFKDIVADLENDDIINDENREIIKNIVRTYVNDLVKLPSLDEALDHILSLIPITKEDNPFMKDNMGPVPNIDDPDRKTRMKKLFSHNPMNEMFDRLRYKN
jgi:hypothetical protein